MTWVASGGPCKSGSSQPPSETVSHGHRYDRSKMVWVGPGAEKRRSSAVSFESGSESGSAANHSPPPRWEDTCSSPERDSKHGPPSRDSSVELSASLPQRELYSPINDSSSSAISGSSATTPPKLAPRKKRARTTSSSSSTSSSSFSSTSSSSFTSSSSVIKTPPQQSMKRRRKESELSDGEITSESIAEAEERYKYENLPKAVRKYQVPSKREHSPLSSQTSERSFRSKGHRSQLSDSVGSKGQRSCSPPAQYPRPKRAHSSSPEYGWHDQKKERKRSRRHASPEVRKIMFRVRNEQRVSEDSQESGQLSAGRQSTPSPPFARSRSPHLGNLSASTVSSKSFSDSLPSPPPPVIQASPVPPTVLETPSTPGIQGEQAMPITYPTPQGRRPLLVAPLATSPVSEGEFEHVDKDEDMPELSGRKRELSSPEEGQRSPSPPSHRLEAFKDPACQTPDPASHKPDLAPHTPDLVPHTEGLASCTLNTKTGTESAPFPPQLRRQWKPSDDWQLPVSTCADSLSPRGEKLMVVWYSSDNQGSPYPPPPVLSVERSPVSLAVEQGEASPAPPLLESQAWEQQLPSPPSTPSPPPLPPLPESPAPYKSPSMEKAESIEVPGFVTQYSAETVPVATQSHVVQESAETVPVITQSHVVQESAEIVPVATQSYVVQESADSVPAATQSHVVQELMPSLPAPPLHLSPPPQRDHNPPPTPLLSQHLGSPNSPPLPTLSPNPQLESGAGQQSSEDGGYLSAALPPVLVLSLQDSSDISQSQTQTDTGSLPSLAPTSPFPLQLLPSSPTPALQEQSAAPLAMSSATLLQQSSPPEASFPPTQAAAVMDPSPPSPLPPTLHDTAAVMDSSPLLPALHDTAAVMDPSPLLPTLHDTAAVMNLSPPSPLPPALCDTAENLLFKEASAPAQKPQTEFGNESIVSVATSQSVTASSVSEHPELKDSHMPRQQIHLERSTSPSDLPITCTSGTSLLSTKPHHTSELARPSSPLRSSSPSELVKCTLLPVASVKWSSPKSLIAAGSVKPPFPHMASESVRSTSTQMAAELVRSTSPQIASELVRSTSPQIASELVRSASSQMASELVRSTSPTSHVKTHSTPFVTESLKPAQSTSPPETIKPVSLPVASVKPPSPKSRIAAESVDSPSPLKVHSPSESARPLSPYQSVNSPSPPVDSKSANSLSLLRSQILQSAKPTSSTQSSSPLPSVKHMSSSVDSWLASEPAKPPSPKSQTGTEPVQHPSLLHLPVTSCTAISPVPPKSPSTSESVNSFSQPEPSHSETKSPSQPKSPNSISQLPQLKSPNSTPQSPVPKTPNSAVQSPKKSPNSAPQSPAPPPVPRRRETRSSSQISCGHQEEVRQMVTRRGSGASQREMHRPCPSTPQVRETRSRQDKSPPAKRTRH